MQDDLDNMDRVEDGDVVILQKYLYYLSHRRGCKETDLILGKFADYFVPKMDYKQMCTYRDFLK